MIRAAGRCNGQPEALAHADRELPDRSLRGVSDTDTFEEFGGIVVGAFHCDRESEVIERGVSVVEAGGFGKYAESLTDGPRIFLWIVTKDRNLSGGPTNEIEEDIDRSRFASTVWSEKAEDLAIFDLEGDITDGFDGSKPFREGS